jgi:hypothetical protein
LARINASKPLESRHDGLTVNDNAEADWRHSRYMCFTRKEWSRLPTDAPLLLSEADLTVLRGVNETVALDEIVDV